MTLRDSGKTGHLRGVLRASVGQFNRLSADNAFPMARPVREDAEVPACASPECFGLLHDIILLTAYRYYPARYSSSRAALNCRIETHKV